MSGKQTTQTDERSQRLERLARFHAWREAFVLEHTAAIARLRLLRLRCRETDHHWLPL